MNIHKRTRLTLLDRQEIWRLYQTRLWKVAHLAEHFHVSRPTIYDVLKRAGLQEFTPRDSTNQRFKTLQYGLKRLARVEQTIQERLKREAKRYNKFYPGELVHFDSKRLPLLKGQSANEPREYLFVAIDDFSGVLFAFPSRYWFTIGQLGVFSLGGWSPHLQSGYHVSRPTRFHRQCIS